MLQLVGDILILVVALKGNPLPVRIHIYSYVCMCEYYLVIKLY